MYVPRFLAPATPTKRMLNRLGALISRSITSMDKSAVGTTHPGKARHRLHGKGATQ